MKGRRYAKRSQGSADFLYVCRWPPDGATTYQTIHLDCVPDSDRTMTPAVSNDLKNRIVFWDFGDGYTMHEILNLAHWATALLDMFPKCHRIVEPTAK